MVKAAVCRDDRAKTPDSPRETDGKDTVGDLGAAVDRLKRMRPDLLIVRPYINSMPGHMAAAFTGAMHGSKQPRSISDTVSSYSARSSTFPEVASIT